MSVERGEIRRCGCQIFGKKKIVGEKRENGATSEREKVNSTLTMSRLVPIFSLLVTKNGGEKKKKKKCQWCCRNKRGEREKEVCNCGNSVAKIGERKKC